MMINTNKPTTQLQLLGYAITIVIICLTAFVAMTNRVTTLEANQNSIEDKIKEVKQQNDKILDILIYQKNKGQ